MAAPTNDAPKGWLYGPAPDLLLGCGVLFMVLSAVFAVGGDSLFGSIPYVIPAVLIALISAPHYGATLLRVYDQREDRQGYFLFSVVATLALLAVAGVAMFNPLVGSILATVYLTWSVWHYTAQNYGISMMFLRRRGAPLDAGIQRLFHASFNLSFALVFVIMHGASDSVADPAREVRMMPLSIPDGASEVILPLLMVAYGVATLGWLVQLGRRVERFQDLAPPILISLLQALWWSVPYLDKQFGFAGGTVAGDWDARMRFFPWVACAHAAQYIWITSFYARASDRWQGNTRYYIKILLAGSAIWALPALLFAPGTGEFDWNFMLLLAATVNLHHFILDGAIWKLRQLKIANVLIRSRESVETSAPESPGLRKLVWAIAAIGFVATVHDLTERFVIEPAAIERQDWASLAGSLDRQQWHGKGSAFDRFKLARRLERSGDPAAAALQFEISAAMEPRVESIKRLIARYYATNDREGFVRNCDRLFELPHIERPLPTISLGAASRPEFIEFRDACVTVAEAARPLPPDQSDGAGGTGQGGLVPSRADY